jgi:DNA-binding NtrC family response regulator
MHSVLVCHPDPDTFPHLKADMGSRGWSLEVCDGMLEMLRLIQGNEYEVVVLDATRLNVEVCALLGTIETLEKNPRIVLHVPEAIDSIPAVLLTLDYPIIKGLLTSNKLLEAVQETS